MWSSGKAPKFRSHGIVCTKISHSETRQIKFSYSKHDNFIFEILFERKGDYNNTVDMIIDTISKIVHSCLVCINIHAGRQCNRPI